MRLRKIACSASSCVVNTSPSRIFTGSPRTPEQTPMRYSSNWRRRDDDVLPGHRMAAELIEDPR